VEKTHLNFYITKFGKKIKNRKSLEAGGWNGSGTLRETDPFQI
jgi:hypothetical protein